MTKATLSLRVLTPSQTLLEVEDVRKVRVRLVDRAWLSIYPHHAPLIAETLPGRLAYVTEDEAHEVPVAGGVLRVFSDNTVEILVRGHVEHEPPATDEAFARLAKQLMLTLNAEPGGVLPEGPSD